MKRHLLALLAFAPIFVGAGVFPYLTPSDLQGRKLYEGELDQWNFEREAPQITAYASAAPLAPVLRDSLRLQGAEILARVEFDSADTPDYFRFRAGFKALMALDCDGVYLPEGDRLPEPYRKALGFAKEDAALVARLKELVRKLYASDDLLARVEGRRAVKWLLDTESCQDLSADVLRLEVGAWAYRLEAVLGIEHAPAPKELGPIGEAPRYDMPEDLPVVKMSINVKTPVKLDPAGRVTATFDYKAFAIRVRDAGEPCRLELTMAPGAQRLRYDYQVPTPRPSRAPKEQPPRAPFSARWEIMNGIEPWFPAGLAHGVVPHATYSPSYPDPHLAWSEEKGFSGSCLDFGALAPMAEPRRIDRWRVVVKTGDETLCDVLLVWPAGAESFAKGYRKSLAGGNLEATWNRVVNGGMTKKGGFWPLGLRQRYAMSSYESKFAFFRTKDRCFEIGDLKSDELFWTAYAKAYWGRRPTPERLATLRQDVANARYEYLKACYAGGPFKKPIADRRKSDAATAKAPDADLGGGDGISLDDE